VLSQPLVVAQRFLELFAIDERAVVAQATPCSTSRRYEAPCDPDDTSSQGAPQVRLVTGSKGTDHQTEDDQVG
jgi:hypothetical protein